MALEVLYVTDETYKLHKSSDVLIVRKSHIKIAAIPLAHLRAVVLIGYVQLTTQLIYELMTEGISILYYGYSGDVMGQMIGKSSKNVVLRLAQNECWRNESLKLNYAKQIAKAKVNNQFARVKSWLSEYRDVLDHSSAGVADFDSTVTGFIENIEKSVNISEVMGYEGASAKVYFEYMALLLVAFKFKTRQRRPARDCVNALLNYGYAFLRNELVLRLEAYGFDVGLGFLHGIRYGRESLALDLMEPFRPVFIDDLVVKLFVREIIRVEHFESVSGACVLSPEGKKIFCESYEQYLHKPLKHVSNGLTLSLFDLLDFEIKEFRRAVLSREKFVPYHLGRCSR